MLQMTTSPDVSSTTAATAGSTTLACPRCGPYRNPAPTVDVVIFCPRRGIVLVERANEPHGYALPGGFIDYGETVEAAAVREMREETGLDVCLTDLLGVYSDPARDPRGHTMSVIYIGVVADGAEPVAGDDAAAAAFYALDNLPVPIVFDHACIIADFSARLRHTGRCGAPHG